MLVRGKHSEMQKLVAYKMWTNACRRQFLQPLKKPFEVGLEAPDLAQTTGPAAELSLFIPRM